MSPTTSPDKERKEKCAEAIRQARAAAGLTQAEFARRIGVSASTVARWESGRRTPSNVTLYAIRKRGFKVNID